MKTTVILDNVEVEVEFSVLPAGSYPDQPLLSFEIHNLEAMLENHLDYIKEKLWEEIKDE